MKKLLSIQQSTKQHWVGNGFPVSTMFSYQTAPEIFSPFLLLEYVKPFEFKASRMRKGVGEHPHRGIETVTLVFQGEIEHRDSSGGGGLIGPGDVQWMSAASGIIHDERHSEAFTKSGGKLEMIQLWVNLPAKFKMSSPRYQTIKQTEIPERVLADQSGSLKIIAGQFAGAHGPAQTYSPIDIWTVSMTKNQEIDLPLARGRSALILNRKGRLLLDPLTSLGPESLAVFSREEEGLRLSAEAGSEFVILSGEAIDEPIVGYGPFVMNSEEEILQAIKDLKEGKIQS